MRVSRRRFLKIAVVTAAGATVLGVVVWKFSYDALRTALYRLPRDIPTGSLDAHTMHTLMAVTGVLASTTIDRRHYEDFFDWHARTLPGYKGLYERITVMLDRSARSSGACSFADCDESIKRRIVQKMLQRRKSRVHKLWTAISGRDSLLFDRYIARPILDLFARTDALIILGYEAWPGVPRGLANYRRPPRSGKR